MVIGSIYFKNLTTGLLEVYILRIEQPGYWKHIF